MLSEWAWLLDWLALLVAVTWAGGLLAAGTLLAWALISYWRWQQRHS